MLEAGIYIHIPFCISKCIYCDFLSFSGCESLYEPYVNALLAELRLASIEQISTVYIGGGTPTVLPLPMLCNILTSVLDLPLSKDAEISIEVNPGTVSYEYLKLIKSAGINRLSFGLQSTDNHLLSLLGRVHTYSQFLENFINARNIGFNNINIDLMFGLPEQSAKVFGDTLSTVLNLNPEHVSFYSLTPSENTSLWKDLMTNKVYLPCDETDRKMYYLALNLLANRGYSHYEISNAAKTGFECIHNLDCWLHKPYIGFGLGASSFDGNKRWSNPSAFSDYFARVKPEFQVLSDKELISEAMILGLRLIDGIDELLFESRYGIRPSKYFSDQIAKLIQDGFLERSINKIRLTSLGLDLANHVYMHFL